MNSQLTALRASKRPSPRLTSHRIHFSGTRVKVGPLCINEEAGSPGPISAAEKQLVQPDLQGDLSLVGGLA